MSEIGLYGRSTLAAKLAAMLCLLLPGTCAAATDTGAVVVVLSRSIGGTSCGNGFIVGDGTLVVTARHVVFPEQSNGLHQGEAFVTVLSPYLGDACEVDVIAQDRALDLILLRGPWKGHPALALAQDADLANAEYLEVSGLCDAVAAISAAQPQLLSEIPSVKTAPLVVNAVTVRRGVTRSVLTESAPPGSGWAGAPMFLGSTQSLAGCYTRTQADGAAGAGAAAGCLRALIGQAGAEGTLEAQTPRIAPPANSPAATALYLQAVATSAKGDFRAALEQMQAFLRLRPASAVGYRDAAGQARALKQLDESQKLYAKAFELDPQLISARVLYGQLLHERVMPTNALQHLRYAWEHGRGSTVAVIPICNILREQSKEKECLDLLEVAVKRNPNDSHLWNYLGQSRAALNDHAGAADAFARAADLLPDNEPVRLKACEQYSLAGNLIKAEHQHRTWVAQHPESRAAHYWLARFLARDRAHRDEAIRAAREALSCAEHDSAPSRAAIDALIDAIRSGKTLAGDELRL